MSNSFNLPVNGKKRVIIIGAGFAGLKLARKLGSSGYQVVMIDKRNFHQFQPLFYQVATSGLEPSNISFPIRKVFQQHRNLHFRNTELYEVRADAKTVVTAAGELSYDKLIIATGVDTNYFGNRNIEKYSIPMKSTAQAINLRNRILESFEAAILTDDRKEQSKLLSVVIVGGGPTGVELSGAIAELKRYVLPKDYPELDFHRMKIRLYEAAPKLLSVMSEKASQDALKFLTKLGVEVHLNTMISDYDGENMTLGNGKVHKVQNLVWTAGVGGKRIKGIADEYYAHANRLAVDRTNRVKGLNDIYALGDIAYMETEKYKNGHPQVAQVAIQQAVQLAKNLLNNTEEPFEYKDKGSMATIGRNMAVVDLPKFSFSGSLAWFLWLLVHLMAIVGVKNRLFIIINWAQSYFSRDQSLRVLIRPFKKKRTGA
ncbi:NADH dehydrogenase [Saccharicrinis carchari]|uniref:NADH:ubiquinone reductase (non-electrogenic) n=1 Tax=Saccharicrinis carchari TaxID=1168039 RepID=A0A521FAA7_SACCC|nr:NAD(P)/FAD-dependent oxidoreductase [Saccharicrinis carchari]SMO93077.1 NADH dehydrogenase [Saccharicrinis carchari]